MRRGAIIFTRKYDTILGREIDRIYEGYEISTENNSKKPFSKEIQYEKNVRIGASRFKEDNKPVDNNMTYEDTPIMFVSKKYFDNAYLTYKRYFGYEISYKFETKGYYYIIRETFVLDYNQYLLTDIAKLIDKEEKALFEITKNIIDKSRKGVNYEKFFISSRI